MLASALWILLMDFFAGQIPRHSRRSDGEVIVLHVINVADAKAVEQLLDNPIGRLRDRTRKLLADVRHQFITVTGSVPEEIVRAAQYHQVTDIVRQP